MHHDSALTQQPLGREPTILVFGKIDGHSGDMEHAARVAAHRELRSINRQLFEPQIEEQKRRPRYHQAYFWKRQDGWPTGAFQHAQPSNIETRVPTVPASRELIDFDRLPDLAR